MHQLLLQNSFKRNIAVYREYCIQRLSCDLIHQLDALAQSGYILIIYERLGGKPEDLDDRG